MASLLIGCLVDFSSDVSIATLGIVNTAFSEEAMTLKWWLQS